LDAAHATAFTFGPIRSYVSAGNTVYCPASADAQCRFCACRRRLFHKAHPSNQVDFAAL